MPLVHVPCLPVTDHLCTTEAEIDRYVKDRGPIGAYLAATYSACHADHFARSRSIWDLGPITWLVNPAASPAATACDQHSGLPVSAEQPTGS